MTSYFSGTGSSTVLVVILMASACTESQAIEIFGESASPSGEVVVTWECADERDCRIDVRRNGTTSELFSEVPAPSVRWHSSSKGEVRVSCGDPCHYSVFVSREHTSRAFELPIAVDIERSRVVVARNSTLKVFDIFNGEAPEHTESLDFSPSAAPATVIESITILADGSLRVIYQRGPEFKLTEVIIDTGTQRSAE